jgi:hypothetical protein
MMTIMGGSGQCKVFGVVGSTGHTSETSKQGNVVQQMFELLTERRIQEASQKAMDNQDYRLAAMMTTVAGTRGDGTREETKLVMKPFCLW